MATTVFFADVLGFSSMAMADVSRAEQALDDVALLFSDQEEISRFLQRGSPWRARYGLSDSIFLIADDPVAAAGAAAQFFFHLAFLNSSVPDQAVLMRGALAMGEVKELRPIFAESGKGNVVGEAVVRVAMLEKSGAKGPRLLIDESVATAVRGSGASWLVADDDGSAELLWLLPPDSSDVDLSLLRPVCAAAAHAFLNAPAEVAAHFVAYMDLVLRSLLRLAERDRPSALALVTGMDARAIARRLQTLLSDRMPPEQRALERLARLTAAP